MTGILDTKYLIVGNSAGDIGMAETILGGDCGQLRS
jgi:hypothetical protein